MFYPIWVTLLILAVGLSFWRGLRDELSAAILISVLSIANPLTDRHAFGPRGIEWIGVTEDLVLLLQLGYFAIYKRLWWAVFAAGFQCLAIFIHAARLADIQIGRGAYIAAYNNYGYLVIGSILFGIWQRGRPGKARA